MKQDQKNLSSDKDYREKVFGKFYSMATGEVLALSEMVSPETMSDFIQTSKQLIDEDLMPDHYMEFSCDYSQIKKKAKMPLHNEANQKSY